MKRNLWLFKPHKKQKNDLEVSGTLSPNCHSFIDPSYVCVDVISDDPGVWSWGRTQCSSMVFPLCGYAGEPLICPPVWSSYRTWCTGEVFPVCEFSDATSDSRDGWICSRIRCSSKVCRPPGHTCEPSGQRMKGNLYRNGCRGGVPVRSEFSGGLWGYRLEWRSFRTGCRSIEALARCLCVSACGPWGRQSQGRTWNTGYKCVSFLLFLLPDAATYLPSLRYRCKYLKARTYPRCCLKMGPFESPGLGSSICPLNPPTHVQGTRCSGPADTLLHWSTDSWTLRLHQC